MSVSDQKALEKRMVEEGRHRYLASVNRAGHRLATTAPGRRLLRETVGKVARELEVFHKDKSVGKSPMWVLPYDVLAMLTIERTLNFPKPEEPYANLAFGIAKRLEDEIAFRTLKADNPLLFKRAKNVAASMTEERRRRTWKRYYLLLDKLNPKWTPTEKYHSGVVCLEVFQRVTGLISTHSWREGKRIKKVVRMSPEASEWIAECHRSHEDMKPSFLPMVEEPTPWTSLYDGGYKTLFRGRKTLVKPSRRQYLGELNAGLDPRVLEAINKVQRTCWEINTEVFEVMKHSWENNLGIGGIPSQEPLEIPPKLEDPTPDQKNEWKQKAREIHEFNRKLLTQRMSYARLVTTAARFERKKFYLPYQIDFRGRIYPLPHTLNPQGPDESRGLLRFARTEMMTEPEHTNWLAHHGANCWGFDKVPLQQRVEWVNEHEELIAAVYDDPIDNRWWEGADKPWQFLAFCLEYGRYLDQGLPCPTQVSCQVDGSNNGLQLFSLLLRDYDTGVDTNVVPGPAPKDIYQKVADTIVLDPEWSGIFPNGLPRGATKRPVMTYAYSVTLWSIQKYLEEWIREQGVNPWESFGIESIKKLTALGVQLHKSVIRAVPAAAEGLKWFRACASAFVAAGLPMRWRTPVGFLSIQDVREVQVRCVRSVVGNKIRYSKFHGDGDKLSGKAMCNAISPNVIHSLDSAVLMETVLGCDFDDFFLVHDGFGTHATKMSELSVQIRKAAHVIFKEDVLADLKTQWEQQLQAELPDPPAYGTLDPSCVLDSTYFFA